MPYSPALPSPYNPAQRAAWHAEGLRWIASLFTAAADHIDRNRSAHELALEPVSAHKPFDEFLYDVRFRVQHEMFLR